MGEIHQAVLSQFSLITEFFIGKVLVKERDSRILTFLNFGPADLYLRLMKVDLGLACG
jgi:hypothetical protein